MKESETEEAKAQVEKAFESTFRLIFGECNVTMDGLAPYLSRFKYQPLATRQSSISGKMVALSSTRYPPGAKCVSQDEINYMKKPAPLSLNEIKDIDSIISALGERASYAGNTKFGNSAGIGLSDNCSDSHYVYGSHNIVKSRYVGHSSYIREGSEYIFGCSSLLNCRHLISEIGGDGNARMFEAYVCTKSSDMFFASYCHGCSNVMFSFNLRSRNNCIGNLELPREKYAALRKKLVGESREYIEKHKSFYSIFDYAPPTREEVAAAGVPAILAKKGSIAEVDAAFSQAAKLIFGRELGGVEKNEKFLLASGVEMVHIARTPFGNATAYSKYYWAGNMPKGRMICDAESEHAGKAHLASDEIEGGLERLVKGISKIAFYTTQYDVGANQNIIDTPIMHYSSDSCRNSVSSYSKKCAYCNHAFQSEALFGCSTMMTESTFCIRCHNCVKTSYSLELDACKSCFRCMFCHNCEGLSDSMFCFNAKNLRYAIGNVEVGREEYMRIRQKVVAELLARLEKTGDIGMDIYSIGARK